MPQQQEQPHHMMMSRAKSDPNAPKWWEKSIVKRSSSSIETLVETMMESSQFLLRAESERSLDTNSTSSSSILSLDRRNIVTGGLLGKGSFSVVLEVNDIIIDDEREDADGYAIRSPGLSLGKGGYAIKHLRPDLIQKNSADYFQDAAADLILESKFLAALSHEGILRLRGIASGGVSAYEQSGDYDSFFLLTDRLDGTLKDRILEYQCILQEESLLECFRSGNLQQDASDDALSCRSAARVYAEKIDIAVQLARAIRYLHDQNLVFRDLKPQNVGLIGNTVQLFDFGFCRELPSATPIHASATSSEGAEEKRDEDAVYYMSGKGSLMYLAPEVLGSGRYNQKVDCYSFAMVLYELLTLNKPFHAAANINVFRELICHHKARPSLEFSDIPESVQGLLKHSWDDSVQDRYTMREICERLENLSSELEEQAMAFPEEEEVVDDYVSFNDHTPLHVNACDGGETFTVLTNFARDMRRGYDILTGQTKLASASRYDDDEDDQQVFKAVHTYKSDPIDSLGSMYNGISMLQLEQQQGFSLSCPTGDTAETEDCTQASSCSFEVFRQGADDATEEAFEVTLEQTLSMLTDDDESDFENEEEEEEDDEEEESRGGSELRCPATPPKRTISAPFAFIKTNGMKRRQSCNGAPPSPVPELPVMTRRQSCNGTGAIPSSHWLAPNNGQLLY